jgi:threonine synthase
MATGALVLSVDTDFDGCMAIVQRLAAEAGVYLANSMNSLRLEGQKTLSMELTRQLGWTPPDVVVLPGGNLGNVSAIAAGFDLMLTLGVIDRRPRLVVAQAAAANPLYRAARRGWRFEPMAAGPTAASAIQIGNPVSIRRAIRALQHFDGVVEEATEEELLDASARLDRTGFFACPQTGVALAALEKLAARGDITARDRVVVISTANGLKFADVKLGYHQGRAGTGPGRFTNRPVEVPNDYAAVRAVIEDDIGSR